MKPNLSARKLMNLDYETLVNNLRGTFNLTFDDGEVVEVNSRETIFSWFMWGVIRSYPNTPLLYRHHVKSQLKGNAFNSSVSMTSLLRDVVSVYRLNTPESKKYVKKRIYEVINEAYNELSKHTEAYVTSIDILDFCEIVDEPEISQSLKELRPTQRSIDKCYSVILKSLKGSESLNRNQLAKAVRFNVVKANQVLQCVGPRGFLTDIDSTIFREPILRGYFAGFRDLYDSVIESRSAAKSLFFAEDPLSDSEYFARRLQLLTMIIKNVDYGDCGSTKTIDWLVKPPVYDERGRTVNKGDLANFEGKQYVDNDGTLKSVKITDKHLENKVIKIRSILAGCQHRDIEKGIICSVCFGELHHNLPEHYNLGHISSATMTEQTGQNILSTKHFDGSSDIEPLTLDETKVNFFVVGDDKNSYYLRKEMLELRTSILIPITSCSSLTDLTSMEDIKNISLSRVSEISDAAISFTTTRDGETTVPLRLTFSGRKAMLSYELIEYIFKYGYGTDGRTNFVFDLSRWDYTKPLFVLPYKHYNMADHNARK